MLQEILLPSDVQLAKTQMLRAGDLTCLYESGNLRYIRSGQTELVRMIYAAVRDANWGTLLQTISDEEVFIFENTFLIRYRAEYQQDNIVYAARFFIEGTADSRIVFSMNGTALQPFSSNRIGLCVLHPVAEYAGQPVLITHPDATQTKTFFPVAIAPFQPFLEVQQMNWTTIDGARGHLFFQGDIFETEDQRNWSDNSFKTYSTPQRIPFPVSISRGSNVSQSVILTLSSAPLRSMQNVEDLITETRSPFPAIGFCQSSPPRPLHDAALLALKQIPFHHYRVLLHVYNNECQQQLSLALQEASLLSAKLELLLFFSDDATRDLKAVLPVLKEQPQLVYSLLLLHKDDSVSPPGLLTALYHQIKKAIPHALIGYGTNTFFTELNRQPPPAIPFDFIAFSLHPQVHATDSRTLLENLETLPHMLETAEHFAPGVPVAIAVTLKDSTDIAGADPRQYSYFAAAWTLMSIQQLCNAATISFFETSGPAGLLHMNNKDELKISRVYEVLRIVHSFAPKWIIKRERRGRILLDGLLLENTAGERLFIKMPEASTDPANNNS